MSIKEILRRYHGDRDERIVTEMNKIYKNGFLALSFGLLIFIFYGIMRGQVLLVHGVTDSISYSLSDVILSAWFFLVLVACIIATTRKGFVDDGRFAETDLFPAGYFALWAIGAALGAGIMTTALRILAEIEVAGPGGIMWVADIALGIMITVAVFFTSLLGYYLSFLAAKRRRETLSARFDD